MSTLSASDIFLRLIGAVAIGSIIGFERLSHHKEAGLKTNTLVTLGAAIFGIIAYDSQFFPNWSASQFAIGVITGIGFLGSGIVMHSRGHIQGINSAATIWVASGAGLACGLGETTLAFLSLAVVFVVQYLHRWIESHFAQSPSRDQSE